MNNLTKSAFLLMITMLLSKVLGFAREIVLASQYGTSAYSDAYLVSISIPTILFAMIAHALANTFIPMHFDIEKSKSKVDAMNFLNNILHIVTIITIVISIIGFIYTEKIVKIFAIGFEGETLEIAVSYTKVVIIGIIFIGISNMLTSFLQINDNFTIPGLVGIPYNILIIIAIIISSKLSPNILPYGVLLAILSQVLIQIPYAYKYGYRYKAKINLKDEYLNKMIYLSIPVIIGIGVNQINYIVDKSIASTLVEGSISALNYANRLNNFVIGVFIASIASVIYPMLSKISCDNDKKDFIDIISNSINVVVLIIIPISVGAIVLSEDIVSILFKRGAFDSRAAKMTSTALIFYSIGMIGFGLRDILGKVFYSFQDTKTPMINGAIAMIMNIILNLVLVKFMGYAGLAFATSISSIVCILILFNSLKKKIGYFGQDKIIKTVIKSLISAVVMGVVTYFMNNILANMLGKGFIQEIIALFGCIVIGALVYGSLVIVLKVEEVSMITNIIKKKRTA